MVRLGKFEVSVKLHLQVLPESTAISSGAAKVDLCNVYLQVPLKLTSAHLPNAF